MTNPTDLEALAASMKRLDAWVWNTASQIRVDDVRAILTALRTIAQDAEPVAWMYTREGEDRTILLDYDTPAAIDDGWTETPLYTHPSPAPQAPVVTEGELLPCPFCGGAMELTHDHTIEEVDSIRHVMPSVNCPIEGASGFCIGNDQLVAAWNTRPRPTDTSAANGSDGEVERVARAVHDALYEDKDSGAWMSGKCPLDSVTIDGDVDLLNAARAAIAALRHHDDDQENG